MRIQQQVQVQVQVFAFSVLFSACVHHSASSSLSPVLNADEVEFTKLTSGKSACLVISDASGKVLSRSNEVRCERRYLPYSTFKVVNTIVGIESGVIEAADSEVSWDSELYPAEDWWPDVWTSQSHTLRSAFRYSLVPFYRGMATEIGSERMAHYVAAFEYGNASIGGALDSFWLDGDIAISANEQLEFLRRFYLEALGVSGRTTAVVKDIFVRERESGFVLSAKTGTGSATSDGVLGWLVGYVEHEGDVHYFAFNVTGEDNKSVTGEWRIQTVKEILRNHNLWPKGE